MNHPVAELRNLGPRCAEWLAAYRELVIQGVVKPHKMLLYALAGALEDVGCLQLPPERKQELVDEAGL